MASPPRRMAPPFTGQRELRGGFSLRTVVRSSGRHWKGRSSSRRPRASLVSSFILANLIRAVLTQNYSGAGPIGLVSLLSARAAGAEPIVITDLFQNRLDFAKTLVPGVKTLLIQKGWTPQEVGAKAKEAAGAPLKLALECTGVQSSIVSAVYVSPIVKPHQ